MGETPYLFLKSTVNVEAWTKPEAVAISTNGMSGRSVIRLRACSKRHSRMNSGTDVPAFENAVLMRLLVTRKRTTSSVRPNFGTVYNWSLRMASVPV